MAFDEHKNVASFTHEDDHRNQNNSLSRLSICNNFEEDHGGECDGVDDGDDGGEADEEPSDSENKGGGRGERSMELNFWDSDKESGSHSLPATPPRRRRRNNGGGGEGKRSGEKAYASENEAEKGKERRRGRRVRREYPPWVGSMRRSYEANMENGGESDQGGGGGGVVVVVTRPIGGGRALCMDLEEVKACKDLGFELEPGRVSYSAGSTLDTTSSGGNSPISNWRISSPGDDPRDVKARLKAWAQAVAFVSTSRHPSS